MKKEETENKLELLKQKFVAIQRLENSLKDVYKEVLDVDKYDPNYSKRYSLSIRGDYKYDRETGRAARDKEQYIAVPKELGDEFLEKLLTWKKKRISELEAKIESIQVFDPSTIYNN